MEAPIIDSTKLTEKEKNDINMIYQANDIIAKFNSNRIVEEELNKLLLRLFGKEVCNNE